MIDDALELVRLRNDFYRDNYRRVVTSLLLALVIIIILLMVLIYKVRTAPEPRYFATSSNGVITQLIPLSSPKLNDSAVTQWTLTAVRMSLNLDFLNFREELNAARQNYFTSDGYQNFEAALNKPNGMMTKIIDKRYVTRVVAMDAPVIKGQGVVNGRYTWRIQIPLLISYEGSGGVALKEEKLADVLVVRMDTLDNPAGVGIQQIIL